jgi:hypothetical protein
MRAIGQLFDSRRMPTTVPSIVAITMPNTATSVCYYYFTNHATSSIVYGRRLMNRAALDERLAFNIDTILAIVTPI